MMEWTNEQCSCINKRMNGRQLATDRLSSLLAFGYAGLALAFSDSETVLCGRGKRYQPCDWSGECLRKHYLRLGPPSLHREEKYGVIYRSFIGHWNIIQSGNLVHVYRLLARTRLT